jgi:hypothetical protein
MEVAGAHFRRRTHELVRAMTPDERIALAFALGEDDVRVFMEVHQIGRDDAVRRLRRMRHHGRRPSVAAELDEAP